MVGTNAENQYRTQGNSGKQGDLLRNNLYGDGYVRVRVVTVPIWGKG